MSGETITASLGRLRGRVAAACARRAILLALVLAGGCGTDKRQDRGGPSSTDLAGGGSAGAGGLVGDGTGQHPSGFTQRTAARLGAAVSFTASGAPRFGSAGASIGAAGQGGSRSDDTGDGAGANAGSGGGAGGHTGAVNPGPGGAGSAGGAGDDGDAPGGGGGSGGGFTDVAGMDRKRQELIQFLWGGEGFPSTTLPSSVVRDVVSPVRGLGNLERVDVLFMAMDAGIASVAHHFIPSTGKNNRLVILHHGHDTSLDDDPSTDNIGYGMQRTLNRLLMEGYSVLGMYMPGCLPVDGPSCLIPHDEIVATQTRGSGMKFFLEPVAICLNYLQARSETDDFPAYTDFSMVGLSGGGWTATVYAALDPRIAFSVPVAGSLPLSLRSYWSWGDEEQTHAPFYAIAGYVDLYVMGGFGAGRRQVQVLNRYDNCCFGQSPLQFKAPESGLSYDDALRAYETDVRQRLKAMNSGSFRLEIDDEAPSHSISWNTLVTIIIAELGRGNAARALTF